MSEGATTSAPARAYVRAASVRIGSVSSLSTARSASSPTRETGQRMCPLSEPIGSGAVIRASTKTGSTKLAGERRVSWKSRRSAEFRRRRRPRRNDVSRLSAVSDMSLLQLTDDRVGGDLADDPWHLSQCQGDRTRGGRSDRDDPRAGERSVPDSGPKSLD